jgi:ADP-L-glycero-D-manno-heptose 6-epimerase
MNLSTNFVVTGAGGFIGAYLVNSLLKLGVDAKKIWACDDLAAIENHECTSKWRSLEINKISPEELLCCLDQVNPGLIIHMGACSRTDETRWDYLIRVNIEYSKSIWNWCSSKQIPLIYASSAATYGDGSLGFSDQMSREEMQKLIPLNLYGKSKWIFDLWSLDEVQAGNTPNGFWGFKFFNVYGPGEAHKTSQASVVYHAHKQVIEKGQITLFKSHHPDYKDGEQMRDFVCVEDIAKVCEWVIQKLPKSGLYNLGTGKAQTFLDLANGVKKATGNDSPIAFIPTPEHLREHYQYFTEANIQALRAAGYREPFMNLEEGIRFTLKDTPSNR